MEEKVEEARVEEIVEAVMVEATEAEAKGVEKAVVLEEGLRVVRVCGWTCLQLPHQRAHEAVASIVEHVHAVSTPRV